MVHASLLRTAMAWLTMAVVLVLLSACTSERPTEPPQEMTLEIETAMELHLDVSEWLLQAPVVSVDVVPIFSEQETTAIIYQLPDGKRVASVYWPHEGLSPVDSVSVDGQVMAQLGITELRVGPYGQNRP